MDIRETLGLTQLKLAKALGVERGAVGNWEHGAGIGRKNLVKLSELAGTTIDWIEKGIGQPPQPVGQRNTSVTIGNSRLLHLIENMRETVLQYRDLPVTPDFETVLTKQFAKILEGGLTQPFPQSLKESDIAQLERLIRKPLQERAKEQDQP